LDRSTTVWRGRRKSGKGRPRFRFQHKNPASTSRSLVQVICQTSEIQRMLENGRQRDLYQQRVSAVDKRLFIRVIKKWRYPSCGCTALHFFGGIGAQARWNPTSRNVFPPTFSVRQAQALKARPSQSQSSNPSASWLCRGTTDSCFLHKHAALNPRPSRDSIFSFYVRTPITR
jgi:hypothetical protein